MKLRNAWWTACPSMVLGVGLVTGCGAPAPHPCQRFDAVSLNRENGFSARVDWPRKAMLDLAGERIEVALSVARPLHGPVELVHVVGDTEADRWTLQIPDPNRAPVALCQIGASSNTTNCGASITNAPFSPAGYYYLKEGDNTVFEAGLAFFVCD